jgi:tRNA dimethylallyltransferase
MTRACALVGPTAVGKTAAALEVAERIGAEIVSVDSMQVYRGMDIGTDKAGPEMRARVPHHLLDLCDSDHDVTVAEFQRLARDAIDEIATRDKTPLLVGGSGLYFRAVVDDLEFPPRSPELRTSLEERVDERGAEALYSELRELDPLAASRIEPNNARRIVRALEVIELTGRPFSANTAWDRYESRYDLRAAGLEWPREELYERIEQRVARMLERGLIEEVRALDQRGMSVTARQALGYKQILDAGPNTDMEALRGEIVRATKRFARRQLAWFKADPRIEWFDASDAGLAGHLRAFFAPEGALP